MKTNFINDKLTGNKQIKRQIILNTFLNEKCNKAFYMPRHQVKNATNPGGRIKYW